MTSLRNEITIHAPIENIWAALTDVTLLQQYDPTVKTSSALTDAKNGIGAARKVLMLDGKNWFEEQCTVCAPHEALVYELTACSFPVHKLKHTYSFEQAGSSVKVKQVMEYEMKFGLLGKLMDVLMVRKQSDSGIKKFFSGLKNFVEKQ